MSGTIVGIGAAVGAVVGGGSSILGISKSNRNMIKAFKQQMKYLQINYNYNQAALDRQEKSMYDSAMVELLGLSMNAYQNNAQVEAAMAETGLEGRSQEKIQQVIHGQTSRQETATKEAYKQGVWEVRGQKEALYITTKNEVEQYKASVKSNLVGGTQAFMQVMSDALQGASIGASVAGLGSAAAGALSTGTKPAVDAISSAAPTVAKDVSTESLGVIKKVGASNISGALKTGLKTGAVLGAVGSVTKPVTSATSSSSSSLGSSFIGRFNTLYDQHKPWLDFYANIGKLGGQIAEKNRRGGYFY
jgi:hypothetical protein